MSLNSKKILQEKAKQFISDEIVFSVEDIKRLIGELRLLIKEIKSLKERKILGELIWKLNKKLPKPLKSNNIKEIQGYSLQKGKIYIGGRPSLNTLKLLKLSGFNMVVTLLKENENPQQIKDMAESLKMEWLWVPLSASALPEIKKGSELHKIMFLLRNKISEGQAIFIHCAAGIHRTGAFTNAFLRFSGYNREEAYQIIKKIREVTAKYAVDKHWRWGDKFYESEYKDSSL